VVMLAIDKVPSRAEMNRSDSAMTASYTNVVSLLMGTCKKLDEIASIRQNFRKVRDIFGKFQEFPKNMEKFMRNSRNSPKI
jgi:transcriptional regulator NrdR family protein